MKVGGEVEERSERREAAAFGMWCSRWVDGGFSPVSWGPSGLRGILESVWLCEKSDGLIGRKMPHLISDRPDAAVITNTPENSQIVHTSSF